MSRNITLGRLSRMITGTNLSMALRRTRIRPQMRNFRRLPSRLNPFHQRYASMKTMKGPELSSTSLTPHRSRNLYQTHIIAISSNSSRRSRLWVIAATFMRRSPLRSTQPEQVVTLMSIPMTKATPTSPMRTPPTHHPMKEQRSNRLVKPPLQQLFPPVPMPSSVA